MLRAEMNSINCLDENKQIKKKGFIFRIYNTQSEINETVSKTSN